MTSPTSPGTPHSADSGSLAPTINAIAGGEFSRSRLAALSDLDRSRAAYLRAHWLDISDTERHALLLALAELDAESLDFNFNRVYRVAIEDPNPVIRQLAIEDLWEDDGGDLPPILMRIVQTDPSDDVRAAAAHALSKACDSFGGSSDAPGKERFFELLGSLFENTSESPLVRRRSLGAVAGIGNDPRVTDLVRLGLDDEDQTVVAGAVYAMGRTASERWIPELLEFMQSDDAELRFEAARAAGMIGEADTVPELSELVYDPDAEVRAAAIAALGEIGGPAAIRVLRQVEQDEDFEETESVGEAIDAALLTVNPLERQT